MTFSKGQRVFVTDSGLEQLRDIVRRSTGKPAAPNHHGTIADVFEDGTLLISFDDGSSAPYPPEETRPLE